MKASTYSKLFGTTLNGGYNVIDTNVKPSVARIVDSTKFSNWSWLFILTPFAQSSIFNRTGFHIKVWLYITIAITEFFFLLAGQTSVFTGTYIFYNKLCRSYFAWGRK